MTRRAIIHIGAPRTGTTTLQTLLFRHRADLLQAGILYPLLTPASTTEPHINQQHLGETLDGRRPRAEQRELLDALDAQLGTTDADTLLLSYERFCFLPLWSNAPAALGAVVSRHGFVPELLLTVRAQAGAAQSHYAWRCQFLREARPFPPWFDRAIRDPRLDPHVGLSTWRALTEDRVTAVPLSAADSSAPFALRVVQAIGLHARVAPLLSDGDLVQAENRSLGAIGIEVSRRLCAGGAFCSSNAGGRQVVDFVQEALRRRGVDDVRFQALDAAMLARAGERYARRNDRFARTMWGAGWTARVASDAAKPITEIAVASSLSPEYQTLIETICADVHERFVFEPRPWHKKAFLSR